MWWDFRRRLHETLRLKNVLKRKYQESSKIEGNTIARNWRLKFRESESQICILNSWSTLLELLILTLKSNCLCRKWILSRKEAIIDGSRVMMLSILEGNHTKAEHKIVLTSHIICFWSDTLVIYHRCFSLFIGSSDVDVSADVVFDRDWWCQATLLRFDVTERSDSMSEKRRYSYFYWRVSGIHIIGCFLWTNDVLVWFWLTVSCNMIIFRMNVEMVTALDLQCLIVFGLSMKRMFPLLIILGIDEWMPLSDWSSRSSQHLHPMSQFSSLTVRSYFRLANWIAGSDSIVINDDHFDGHFVDLIKRNFKLEWLIEVRVQCALLDGSFLLLQSLAWDLFHVKS